MNRSGNGAYSRPDGPILPAPSNLNAERTMTPKETVLSLYQAYGSGDPGRIAALLHEDVVWVAPAGNATQVALGLGQPGDAGAPGGGNRLARELIVQFMAHNFARLFREAKNQFRTVVAEGEVVFVEHRLSAVLPGGRRYVNDYCFAFEVQDGRVRTIREYMDTRGGWAQVFGGDQSPAPLLEFVRA
jgi:uncharacterized protein